MALQEMGTRDPSSIKMKNATTMIKNSFFLQQFVAMKLRVRGGQMKSVTGSSNRTFRSRLLCCPFCIKFSVIPGPLFIFPLFLMSMQSEQDQTLLTQ